ncbi:MAG: HAMP domain-containing sensor histidine kinase [Gemmataceae bacterium]
MTGSSPGRKAVSLPWLAPSAEAFVACVDDSVNVAVAAAEPALVLHVLRFGRSTAPLLSADWFGDPTSLEAGVTCISRRPADPSLSDSDLGRQVREIGRMAAEIARSIATTNHTMAEVAALVAPLGYYALAATEPDQAKGPLADSVGRRLARRWQLPDWLADVISNLHSDATTIEAVGADPELIETVRIALLVAQERTAALGIVADMPPSERLTQARAVEVTLSSVKLDTPATANPLLVKLLKATASLRRRTGFSIVAKLESENELLRTALDRANARFQATLRDAKLAALAELAAGAGHEINNPLAVISGNCQRLLAKEEDPETRQTLGVVIRQTMRAHGILRGLMQFARPARPHVEEVAVVPLVEDIVGELSDLTADQDVQVEVVAENDEAMAVADGAQVKTIVHHLVRNAIDAAGPNGWVKVTVDSDSEQLSVLVEDSGPGLTSNQREHLFDPFYSGRNAGRGRGLGLSIAWRLAQSNGGDVQFVPVPSGPTRFILTLPNEMAQVAFQPMRKAG